MKVFVDEKGFLLIYALCWEVVVIRSSFLLEVILDQGSSFSLHSHCPLACVLVLKEKSHLAI